MQQNLHCMVEIIKELEETKGLTELIKSEGTQENGQQNKPNT